MSLNEADIAGEWARHCWKQGADRILVADGNSDDGTAEILESEGVEVVSQGDTVYCEQAECMTRLSASVDGWVVPADVDEFWCAAGGQTVAELLNDQPDDVSRYYATVYHHTDRDHRWPTPKLPKVAFRTNPDVFVEMGNHEVQNVSGHAMSGQLQVRELQFRGRDHYHRKVTERIRTLDPKLSPNDAVHYRRLIGMTSGQLDAEWDAICAKPTLFDPIPS